MDMLLLVLLPSFILPWVCKVVWPHQITWKELAINIPVGLVVGLIVYAIGAYTQVMDVEIINGEVLSKTRVHDSYVRSYSCRCRQTCSGSGNNRTCTQTCDTCYEDRYTVTWKSHTNVGDYTIDHKDSGSRSVYNSADPAFYSNVKVGDPAAARHSFVNYVKAAPSSLFHQHDSKSSVFANMIPEYPADVYNFYSLNRALTVNVPIPDIQQWNHDISVLLKKLGPQRQANVIVLFVNTPDQAYIHALEGKWIGGKKNDIIVVIGTTSYPKIDWVAVSSWTDEQMFKVKLRDDIMAVSNIDRTAIMNVIDQNTMSLFKRKSMKDFEYLKHRAEPPIWVLTLAIVLSIITSIGCSFYFYKNDPFGNNRRYR